MTKTRTADPLRHSGFVIHSDFWFRHSDLHRMTFEITTTRHFSAGHQLVLYDGSLEPLHGHNWVVKVSVTAPNPSAENVAVHVGRSMSPRLPSGVTLRSVTVWETPENSAAYYP